MIVVFIAAKYHDPVDIKLLCGLNSCLRANMIDGSRFEREFSFGMCSALFWEEGQKYYIVHSVLYLELPENPCYSTLIKLILYTHNKIHAPHIFELLNMCANKPNHGDSSLSVKKSKNFANMQTQITFFTDGLFMGWFSIMRI